MLPFKRAFALCLSALLFAFGARPAHAHAVVTESSLASEPVHPNHATTVVLVFNSRVETRLSRVFLVSAGDVYHPVDIALGKRKGELLVKLPALEPGDYAIKYKVFAADGHLTENAIRFRVGD
jgi:methionine-rich copper-binding protein CopC